MNDFLCVKMFVEEDVNKKIFFKEKEYGFVIGGLIIKDKMYFFVMYEGKCFNMLIIVVLDDNVVLGVFYFFVVVVVQFGLLNLLFEENLYFGKIDWELMDCDCFELSVQICKENQMGGIGGFIVVLVVYKIKNDDKCYVLCWQYSGEVYFNELLFIYEDVFNVFVVNNVGNGVIYIYLLQDFDLIIVVIGVVNLLVMQNKGQKGLFIQDDFIFNDLQWNGDYVIKMGFKYKDIMLDVVDVVDINLQFYYDVMLVGVGSILYKVFFIKLVSGLGLSFKVEIKVKQFGIYVQDDWVVNDKFMLNFGVCWDYEKNLVYIGFVILQNVVDVLYLQDFNVLVGQIYVQLLVNGGVNVVDYISNGYN